jgi:ATP-binding cassette subfamily D (ALD) protein 3
MDLAPGVAAGFLQQLQKVQSGVMKRKMAAGGGLIALATAAYVGSNMMARKRGPGQTRPRSDSSSGLGMVDPAAQKRKGKTAVNREFFQQLSGFLPILIPGVWTREVATMLGVFVILMSRTWLDFWMIANNANILGAVVQRDFSRFLKYIIQFALMQFPTSLVNNLLKHFIDNLALYFRERLTLHLHQHYMKGFTYYAVSNLDNRIDNADQMLTQDIDRFASSLSTLYSNITKPIIDVILFYRNLVQQFGWGGPTTMILYFVLAGAVMTKLRAPFAWYASTQAKLEGEFRYCHSRLITNGEEIAFYNGGEREKGIIDSAFHRLVRIVSRYLRFRTVLGVIDSCVTKYSGTLVGYFIVTAPIFDPRRASRYVESLGGNPKQIMEDYTRYMRLLMVMVRAVGRLVSSGRELSHLAGYTSRVAELYNVLGDINSGTFVRTQTVREPQEGEERTVDHIDPITSRGELVEIGSSDTPIIRFEHVPIVTPNGDVLVRELNFEIKAGMNCLIAGPNGCGKSSLFRTLGDLWPLCGGRLTRPNKKHLFYIPQRPYLAIGTLRDQVVYPHTKKDLDRLGVKDSELLQLMDKVALSYLVKRFGGWDARADWWDVLSGGEKQRIAMARLFYHRPLFAVLDECTSAVSVDIEAAMYEYCKEIGCTLFTISHRKTLWRFHEYVLRFDGKGGYEFFHLDSSYEGL